MSRISDRIRVYVNDPFSDSRYGDWGMLRIDQRRLIRELCDTCDMFEKSADELMRKRREGEWKPSPSGSTNVYCSACGAMGDGGNYCSHCGASMVIESRLMALSDFLRMVENICMHEYSLSYEKIADGIKRQMDAKKDGE